MRIGEKNEREQAIGSPWILRQSSHPDPSLRLFLLPPAGGSSLIFRSWKDVMPPGVDVYPIQLPGRGARVHEPPFTRVEPLVQSLATALAPLLNKPFALFGHSMGALLGFELSRHLRKSYGIEPLLLFASGGRSPDVPEDKRDFLLPDADFVAMLRALNGTPAEILDNPEALRLLLPVLRADFEVTQTYQHNEDQPLSCRIKVFGGTRDSTTGEELLLPWRKHTRGSFSLSMLPGSHFFIEESRAQLLAIVAHELRRALDQVHAMD
jgi:medium-chain acyl-[acyl-carrier-protein] hydrolase